MRLLRRILPFLLVAAFTTTSVSSCFIFKGKNHCGDCPSFKNNSKPKKPKKHR